FRMYLTNLERPYSNAKLEATNNLIKVIKRNAFGFRNFENFKKRILIALNIVITTRENGWLVHRL
uniref:transposase n=1 Tax=Streptococcus suis TaxID=1307 RepID=UPI00137B352B